MSAAHKVTLYLPDQRDVEIGRYGAGNSKVGFGVFTYSKLAGSPSSFGSCPGATPECEAICYAKRIRGPVRDIYALNTSAGAAVPPIPSMVKELRIHISGDFDSVDYIHAWRLRLQERPDVVAWAYTRSWRVPTLLPHLEDLRKACPNLQLFASMDPSKPDEWPPEGWRRAWIYRKEPRPGFPLEERLTLFRKPTVREHQASRTDDYILGELMTAVTKDQTASLICPEETGLKPNCLECGYCFRGNRLDVTFIEHHGDEP